jgi:hypothetical protein
MKTTTRAGWAAALLTALALAAGCDNGPATGEVTGTVTVDGQTPAAGSSIRFVPADGKSPTAGATIEGGTYTAKVPVGTAKVEIRVPRVKEKFKGDGPGGDRIEESLPAKYNEKTELTFEVKPGKNEKNWEVWTTK